MPPVTDSGKVRIMIRNCARCGGDHEIDFQRFKDEPISHPCFPVDYEWWGSCPVNGDPVLMTVIHNHPDEIKPQNTNGGDE